MTEYTVFPNAPITEALLDIRVELPAEVDIKKLESFHDRVKDRYPDKKTKGMVAVQVEVSPDGTPQSLPALGGPQGFLFRSPSEHKIVQARVDGFTFNKLKPYEEWKKFRNEARELWNAYREMFKPTKITRIALRYINRIEVPLPFGDFKEYILTNPEIAPKLPQSLAHFYMQLVMPKPDIQATAVITQTMEKATENNLLPLVLDIDVFKEALYTDEKTMWDDIEQLRTFKNDIFFDSVTDKAKELFK